MPPRYFALAPLLALFAASCGAPAPSPVPGNMAVVDIPRPDTSPSVSTPRPGPSAVPLPNAQVLDLSLWLPTYLPPDLRMALAGPLQAFTVPDPAAARVRLEVGETNTVSTWVFALAAPFSSTRDGMTGEELRLLWQGGPDGPSLLMEPATQEMFSALWGPAGAGSLVILPAGALVEYAWAHPDSLAIVPFEALEPRWKVIPLDGVSPLRRDFDMARYPLKISFSLSGDPGLAALIASNVEIPSTNLDPERLTIVAMTGVTALVRATAYTMEQRGMTYPAQDIRAWLLGADITHISNEVPFAEDCPYPDPVQEEIRFCSRDQTIQLLEDIGTDVVELTGDHFQDWGTQAMTHTLEMYRARGWLSYGGGANLAAGRQPLLIERGPNRIAFIGCNAKGGPFAQASESQPGAASCDLDWMAAEIARLSQEGYLVLATFQHNEYYTYQAQPDQQRDFRRMAEAGAVVVSGSQAHQPQGMEFLHDSFIHYGLGNLFFDQYGLCEACRQALIDRHVFYDGRYIGTELLPVQFVDYARSRPMTPDEADALLETLFLVSGWR